MKANVNFQRPHYSLIALLFAARAFPCQSAEPLKAVSPEGSKAGEERTAVGLKLCWCPAGTFLMGSPRGEPGHRADEEQVKVKLTRGFWMSKYEVTQGQWLSVMGKLPGELTDAGS